MKKILILLAAFSLVSCLKDDGLDISKFIKDESCVENISTRSFDPKYCNVSFEDVRDYLKFKSLLPDGKGKTVIDITPVPDENNPSIYVINYNDSWEIISGDKRTPAVIASGSGKFDPQSVNESCQHWITSLAEQIEVLKSSPIETKHAQDYLDFWEAISIGSNDHDEDIAVTRSEVDTIYHPVPGHYELVSIIPFFEQELDSIGHLVKTKWGQRTPYNWYCPMDRSRMSSDGAILCYTGCVPLAGGQIINYFHQFGMSIPICDSAYVNTREFPYTDWSKMRQWHMSESNWAKMNTADSSRIAAILVANIGKGVIAEYHYYPYYAYNEHNELCYYDGSTLARLDDLAGYLSQEYIDSYFSVFQEGTDYDYIYELLQDQYPSIIGAEAISGGAHQYHAFIVDRFKRTRPQYYFTYRFYPDNPNYYCEVNDVIYIYTSPEIVYFGMNWGFYGQNDDTWCVSSGDWYCGSANYLNRISMITFRDNPEDNDEPEEPEICR